MSCTGHDMKIEKMEGVKLNELRLGDLVDIADLNGSASPNGYNWAIEGIFSDIVHLSKKGYSNSCNIKSLRGIVITEEWCQKLLTKTEMQYHFIQADKWQSSFIFCWDNVLNCLKIRVSGFWYEVKTIHQLQNLIFSLTGEELPIKETI